MRAAFGSVVRAAFGDAAPAPPVLLDAPMTPVTRALDAAFVARGVWDAAVPATGTPAHLYMAARRVWPPHGVGPPLPPDIRWSARIPDRLGPPANHGAVLFGWRRGGSLEAISVEALSAAGRRPPRRWRRTYGSRAGAQFTAARGDQAIVLTEGEVTALAAVWMHPGAEVVAAGGTAGMRRWCPPPGDRRRVIVEADGDAAGDAAARAVRDRVGATIRYRVAGDAADDLADAVDERAAIIEVDAGASGPAAMAAAWDRPFDGRVRGGQPAPARSAVGRP